MTLAELKKIGESAEITKIRGRGAFRRRVMEMGLVVGETISLVRKAPMKDPVEYKIKGYKIILRNSEAKLIEVDNTIVQKEKNVNFETQVLSSHKRNESNIAKSFTIALIGNSTSGKTTIFNYLTKQNERVGNYAGVTIELKKGQTEHRGYKIDIIDMPGVYALSGEQLQNNTLRELLFDSLPDVIINVVDATNLERSLYLTTDLIDSDLKVIMALNMYDDFIKINSIIDFSLLGKLTGIPVTPVTAVKSKGIDELLNKAIEVYEDKDLDLRHIHINYGEQLEESIKNIQSKIKIAENSEVTNIISSRFLAIKLLQNDTISHNQIKLCSNNEEINRTVVKEKEQIEKSFKMSSEQLITEYKYGFINGALKETLETLKETKSATETLDSILTHKLFGLPIFFFFMWVMFTATFKLGSYPMTWIESLVSFISSFTAQNMPNGTFKDLLIDGVISGVGGVLVFLPNILILYFFISLMEDTGYMSRAVFIMDKIMHKIGLHGKSFIPLVMGFGCNVPGILASRMLENKKERIITILINPFISCNARLPVYILFITAFFPTSSGTVLFAIYFTGILMAVLTALLLKRFMKRTHDNPFVMELPPYRSPKGKMIVKNMWSKSAQYLKKIGGVILIASVIFWALSYFPTQVKYTRNYHQEIEDINKKTAIAQSVLLPSDTAKLRMLNNEKQHALTEVMLAQKSEHKELSFLGMFGHFIEPVIKPLGFDWRIGISIIAGVPAKEIIVSSLSVLYQVDNSAGEHNTTLVKRIQSQTYVTGEKKGKKIFDPAVALAFMIFVLLYIPCIGTLTAIGRETGSWKWSAFSVVYSFALAWILAFAVYHVGSWFLG